MRVPGLAYEYLIDEIRSLDINYNNISRRAGELGLSNLLKYICTPFNLDQIISLSNLRDNGITPTMDNIYSQYDWRELMEFVHNSNVIVSTLGTGVFITIPGSLHSMMNRITSMSPVKDTSVGNYSIHIRVNPHQLKSYLEQVYAQHPYVTLGRLVPDVFSFNQMPDLHSQYMAIRRIQDNLAENIEKTEYSQVDVSSLIRYVDLFQCLEQSGMKRDIINSILNYTEPINVHGVHLDINELRLLDLLISLRVPVQFSIISVMNTISISIFTDDDNSIQSVRAKLISLYGVDRIVREEQIHVTGDNRYMKFCIRGFIHPYDPFLQRSTLIDGELDTYKHLQNTAHVMNVLHSPVNMSRTVIAPRIEEYLFEHVN